MPEVRILHTSDFHDRLTPALAARLRALKAEHGALLIDTGDAIRAANVTVRPGREQAIDLMNEAGYDAMGLGNREFFFRKTGMAKKTGHAQFPRVCANLQAKGGDLRGIRPWAILEGPEGARVGVFGLMPTMINPRHAFDRVSDLRFLSVKEAFRQAVAALAGQADLMVALLHRPVTDTERGLLGTPSPVDLVLSGHSHRRQPQLERPAAGGPPWSHVGAYATHVRLIGLRLPEKAVTIDELLSLAELETSDG